MDFKLLEVVNTTEDRDDMLYEIDALLSSLYENKGQGFESTIKSKVRFRIAQIILEDIELTKLDNQTYLKKVRDELEKMEVISIVLAFEPTLLTLESIASLVKRYTDNNSILETHYDPSIIAGIKLAAKGKYKDMSFLNRFDQVMQEIKKSFTYKSSNAV